ncbi:hypothetical protein AK812_SmicGene47139 [Symbiodinium microadriaticum]|uniref:Uncharacterized protein n=1 Tax=Symbiodinium microadriaticum TaxID=2951 RepID=A0A1Q9BSD8_SYMMI|nr:hypothetical protein AK812_SmicGene47139 [Symbiodinium microadriaticum]
MKDAGLKFKLERSMSKFWQRFAQWRKRMKKMIKKKDKRSRPAAKAGFGPGPSASDPVPFTADTEMDKQTKQLLKQPVTT